MSTEDYTSTKMHFQVKPIFGKMGKLTMGLVYRCGNPK